MKVSIFSQENLHLAVYTHTFPSAFHGFILNGKKHLSRQYRQVVDILKVPGGSTGKNVVKKKLHDRQTKVKDRDPEKFIGNRH